MKEIFVIQRESDKKFLTAGGNWMVSIVSAYWYRTYPEALADIKSLPELDFYQIKKYVRP